MFDGDNSPAKRWSELLRARRLALLGSVALVGAVIATAPLTTAGASSWPPTASSTSQDRRGPPGFADLVAKVKPAVIAVRVRIDEPADLSSDSGNARPSLPPSLKGTPFEKFFRQHGGQLPGRQPDQIVTGLGSGFFISPDGYAVTNNHVVDHAMSVKVTTDDGKQYDAKVIGTDPKTDLALIKVDGKSDFAYVKFEGGAARVGDWVLAVGNPFGLGGTVTAGIISAEGRDIGSGDYDYLQIDAPINKGNSGGPTFDMSGNVIGVNTAIYSPSGGSVGIGFDIPAQTAQSVIAELRDKGMVTRGWLGVQIQPVTSGIAESLGLKSTNGALVDEAQPDSPAAKAGVQSGDVITAVNGAPIVDSRDLARQIGALAPGSDIKLDVLRKGEARTLTVALGTTPDQKQASVTEEAPGKLQGIPRLGVSVAPASRVAGAGKKGVVVTGVESGSPAAEQGLETGDVILDIGGKVISNAADIHKALAEAKADGKHDVLIRVKTAEVTRFVAMPIG